MVMSLSRVLWKVRSKAPTVTASVQGTVSVTGEGYTTIRDSTSRETYRSKIRPCTRATEVRPRAGCIQILASIGGVRCVRGSDSSRC